MFKKGLSIFVASLSVFSGVIWYNAYLPISPKLAVDQKFIPFLMNLNNFLSQTIGGKFGIVPRYKVYRWFFTAATNMDFFTDLQSTAEGLEIKDSVISGVPVKIFQPATLEGESQPQRPGLLFIHGGGLVFGSINWKSYLQQCIMLAKDTKSVLISVEYRLAPEHAFPAQFEDCLTVVQTVANDPIRFGIIPKKIALIGDSSGGMLTAAISQEFAKQNRSELVAQVLVYPWLQLIDVLCLPSYQENKRGFEMDEEQTAYFMSIVTVGNKDMAEQYLNGSITSYFMKTPYWRYLEIPESSVCNIFKENTNSDVALPPTFIEKVLDPHLSPLLADNLEGNSPATLMIISEYDILASEAILYAKRLKAANVPVVSKIYKTYHSFLHDLALPFTNKTIAKQGMSDIVNYLNSVFYT